MDAAHRGKPPSSNCIFVCILPIQKRLGLPSKKKNKKRKKTASGKTGVYYQNFA